MDANPTTPMDTNPEDQKVAAIVAMDGEDRLMFRCPGCKCGHAVPIRRSNGNTDGLWSWNGSLTKPTLQPSIIVTYSPEPPKDRPARCHSWVTDGHIKFLGDSHHNLRDCAVPLPSLED